MRPAARAQPDRLVVVAPVEHVGVAGFLQQIGRHGRLRDPWPEPAARARRLLVFRCVAVTSSISARSFRFVEGVLAFGVGAAMGDDLVAAAAEGGDQLGRLVVEPAVDQHAGGQGELVEGVAQPPGADAVAVVAPSVIEHVGLAERGDELGAETLAERKGLQVEPEIDRRAACRRASRRRGRSPIGESG